MRVDKWTNRRDGFRKLDLLHRPHLKPQPLQHRLPSRARRIDADLWNPRGYFQTNAARMDYPRFRALGLPIGSGAVESLAKHLVQRRMKRAGMRWAEPGGEALLALLAHRAADRLLPALVFTAPFLPRRLTPKQLI